jgi:hypothetical protein
MKCDSKLVLMRVMQVYFIENSQLHEFWIEKNQIISVKDTGTKLLILGLNQPWHYQCVNNRIPMSY